MERAKKKTNIPSRTREMRVLISVNSYRFLFLVLSSNSAISSRSDLIMINIWDRLASEDLRKVEIPIAFRFRILGILKWREFA